METYPLHSVSLEQAKKLQFKAIDAVTRNFSGEEVLHWAISALSRG